MDVETVREIEERTRAFAVAAIRLGRVLRG